MAPLVSLRNSRCCFLSVYRLPTTFMLVIIFLICLDFVQSDASELSENCKGSTNYTGLKGIKSIESYL